MGINLSTDRIDGRGCGTGMRSADGETDLPLIRHELWHSEATAMFSVIFEVHPKQEKSDL